MSAYGCWVYSLKPNSENGVTEDLEDSSWSSTATATATATDTAVTFRTKEIRGTIKLQSHYDQEAFQRRAGSLGYLMQIAYQVSSSTTRRRIWFRNQSFMPLQFLFFKIVFENQNGVP